MATEIEYKKTRGRPRSAPGEKPATMVQALDRGLTLLHTLAETDQATLTELAMLTGMVPSTLHRLLVTLQHHGVVDLDEATQHWTIGVEAFRIGSSFVRRTKVAEAGRPIMRDLMEATGETANLAIADDGDVVFISQVETHETVRAFFWPGTRGAIHASGIGKALLAEFSPEEVKRILQKKGLAGFTPKTITVPEELFADLEEARRRGWSVDDEERNLGMRCLASPIFNQFSEAIAGVSVSGPSVRMTPARDDEIGTMVKQAADAITQAIGGRLPERG